MWHFIFLVFQVIGISYLSSASPTSDATTTASSILPTTTVNTTNGTTAIQHVQLDSRLNKTTCYAFVGCFDNFAPFDNAQLMLPKSPQEVGTEMQLFSRQNPQHGDFLNFTDLATITGSHFSSARKTKFIIHGFSNSIKTPWLYEMKDELLKLDDFNVIVVTWGPGASFPFYEQAVANTRMVGTQLRLTIDLLVNHAGAKLSDIHLIGHSLGAHTAGYAGYLLHGKLGRITGMDAAEPDFELHPVQIRLDPSDAQFVDCIHTNGAPMSKGGAGLMQPSGHVDFYVNGGETQPDCPNQISGALSGFFSGGGKGATDAVACSHSRSHELFTESINSPCPFTAYPCKDFPSFSGGQCLSCGTTGCSQLGYYADQYHARGKMYLNTRLKAPFCGFHYIIVIDTVGPKDSYGTLSVRLRGDFGNSGWIKYIDDDQIPANRQLKKMIISAVEVGDVKFVDVLYNKRPSSLFHWFGGEKSYEINSVAVTSGEIGGNFHFCFNGMILQDNTQVHGRPSTTRKC